METQQKLTKISRAYRHQSNIKCLYTSLKLKDRMMKKGVLYYYPEKWKRLGCLSAIELKNMCHWWAQKNPTRMCSHHHSMTIINNFIQSYHSIWTYGRYKIKIIFVYYYKTWVLIGQKISFQEYVIAVNELTKKIMIMILFYFPN